MLHYPVPFLRGQSPRGFLTAFRAASPQKEVVLKRMTSSETAGLECSVGQNLMFRPMDLNEEHIKIPSYGLFAFNLHMTSLCSFICSYIRMKKKRFEF
jgi:hypothetical protein